MPAKDENGDEIHYTVKEAYDDWELTNQYRTFYDEDHYGNGLSGGYDPWYDPNEDPDSLPKVEGYNLLNVHKPEQITVSGSIGWVDDDDRDGIRPASVTVTLLADGNPVRNMTVNADANGDWNFSFEGLDKNAKGKVGVPVVYTVEQSAVDSYTTVVTASEDG